MPNTDSAPASSGPTLRDPLLGLEMPMYLGGDEPVVEEPTGDRGDAIGSEPQATEPKATAPVVDNPVDNPEPQAAEPQAPVRDPETGRFMKQGEPAAEPQVTENPVAKSQEPSGEEPDDTAPRIPKVRLDKEIEKRKQLEARVKELEGQQRATDQAATQTYDFDAAEKEFMDLLLDGKTEEAAAKRREIRTAERAEYQALATQQATEVNTKDQLRTEFERISTKFETDYPGFNPESDQYDEAALEQAKAIYAGYLNSGIFPSPIEAFEKALLTTVAANGWAPPAPKSGTKPQGQPRTAAARVAAITGQPPVAAAAGQSGAASGAAVVPDPSTLTDAQLAALPPATLARLRGDVL